MASIYKYDLFISYARRNDDDHFVTNFVNRIRADYTQFHKQELNIYFDRNEIKGMDDWQQNLINGLRESRLLLAFVSPEYESSEYCKRELDWWREHEVHRYVLGEGVAPVYVVSVPGYLDQLTPENWLHQRLASYQFFDVRNFYPHGFRALIMDALDQVLADLREQVRDRLLRSEAVEASPSYGLPIYNSRFIGRREELRQLRETLIHHTIGAVTAVQGLGGIGKTELALTYAHAFAWDYPGGRFYLRCAGLTSMVQALSRVGDYLNLPYTDEEKRDEMLRIQRIVRSLDGKRTLLLLDNVDNPALFSHSERRLLPSNIHAIVTTRLDSNQLIDIDCQSLDSLREDDAVSLLDEYVPCNSEAEITAAHEIVRYLGCFTLAVEVVGAYLLARKETVRPISYVEYAAWLIDHKIRGQDEEAAKTTAVQLAWHKEKQFERLLEETLSLLTEQEMAILNYAAHLPPDTIPLPWLRTLVGHDYPGAAGKIDLTTIWESAISRLQGLRLMTPTTDDKLRRMHRLIQESVASADAKKLRRQKAIRRIVDLCLGYPEEYWYQGENAWELTPVQAMLPRMEQWTRSDQKEETPEIRKALYGLGIDHHTLGTIYFGLGDVLGAKRHYLDYHALCRHLVEKEPQQLQVQRGLSISFNDLGDVAKAQGDLANARRYYEDGLVIRRKIASSQKSSLQAQRDLALSYERLADVAIAMGDPPNAERYYHEALTVSRRLVKKQPNNNEAQRGLVILYNKLGDLARKQGDLSGARQYYLKGLEISRTLAERHHALWISYQRYDELGDEASAQDNLTDAKRYFDSALAIYDEIMKEQEDTAQAERDLTISYEKLGDIAMEQNELAQAMQYYQDALAIRLQLSGKLTANIVAQRDLSINYNDLGDVAKRVGDLQRAVQYYRDALKISRKLAKKQPENMSAQRDLSVSYDRLGDVALALEDLTNAMKYYHDALDIRRKLAEQQPESVEAQRDLVISHQKLAKLCALKKNTTRHGHAMTAHDHYAMCYTLLCAVRDRGMYLGAEFQQFFESLEIAKHAKADSK